MLGGTTMTTHCLIRLATDADRPQIRELLRSAFGQEDEADLVDDIVNSIGYLPDLEVVADDGGVVVGHVMLTRAQIEEALPGMMMRNIPAVALAPLAVHPSRQNSGLGSELVREVLDRARILGERIALVLGHPEFYPRFGFHEALSYGIMPPHEVRSDAWMVAELAPGGLTEVRGTARFAAPFNNPKYW